MSLIPRLERRFGRFAIPNLTAIIIGGQALLYLADLLRRDNGGGSVYQLVSLQPSRILAGEAWRLVTFAFAPPLTPIIFFALLGWMLFYLFGSNLERVWGDFRFNVFLLVGWAANVAVAFIAWGVWGIPEPLLPPTAALGQSAMAANVLLYGSVFFAFARLFPDVIINVMFVLPIRIKWLALAAWVGYAYSFLLYDWPFRLFIAASLANYGLFFGREHWREFRFGRRRRKFQAQARQATAAPNHVCRVCGASSEKSPKTLFRYCSKCAGQCCYCPDHIRDHVHVTAEATAAPPEEGAGRRN
jgi:hypothetical protein